MKKIWFLILIPIVLFGCGSYYYFKEAREEFNSKKLPEKTEPSPDMKTFSGRKR